MGDTDFVVKNAKKYKLANDELIDLYSKIQMLVYNNQKKYKYKCSGSGMGENDINFNIVLPQGKKLPEQLTSLFFEKN